MKVLLLDDEMLARKGLRVRLEQLQELGVAGTQGLQIFEAANARLAQACLQQHAIDLAIVDIQLPGISGMQWLHTLDPLRRPLIILSTAHSEYALEAFAVQVVDYLLKPVDGAALKRAWLRAMALRPLHTAKQPFSSAENTGSDQDGANACVALKDGKITHRVSPNAILWIEAAGDYVVVHLRHERLVGRCSLQALLGMLPSDDFARIHRSCIVRKSAITKIAPQGSGDFLLTLETGQALKMSRNYRDALAELR